MFDSNAFLMSFLLANQQKADLESRKVLVPHDFEFRTALTGAITQSSGLAALVMQNEVSGLEAQAPSVLLAENKALQAEVANLKQENQDLKNTGAAQSAAVTASWSNFLQTFCNADSKFVLFDPKSKILSIRVPDKDVDALKELWYNDPKAAMLEWIRRHFTEDLFGLLQPAQCQAIVTEKPLSKSGEGHD